MRRLLLGLALALVLTMVAVAPVSAKPAPTLSGEMTIHFDSGLLASPPNPVCAPGSSGGLIFWYGTVQFDGDLYGMTFESLDGLAGPKLVGATNHYREHFVIYEGDFSEFSPGTCPDAIGTPVLEGDLDGVGSFGSDKIVENGTVTSAVGGFAGWDGRLMHADGVVQEIEVVPGVLVPIGFSGTIRFN
jgi:hypothetical protein